MKRAELLARVEKKINELGRVFIPEGKNIHEDIGKIHFTELPYGVSIFFGYNRRTIGLSNRNPEQAVEEFWKAMKEGNSFNYGE